MKGFNLVKYRYLNKKQKTRPIRMNNLVIMRYYRVSPTVQYGKNKRIEKLSWDDFQHWFRIGRSDGTKTCPDVYALSPEILARFVKEKGITRVGQEYAGAVVAGIGQEHGYAYVRCVASYEGFAKVAGISNERAEAILTRPSIGMMLWSFAMKDGGSDITSRQLKELENGGEASLKLTRLGKDPVLVQQLCGTERDGTYVTSWTAKTEVGHALAGIVLHHFMIVAGLLYFVMIGVGGGRTPFNVPPKLNYYVAIGNDGMWENLTRSAMNILRNEKIAKAIVELGENASDEQVFQILAAYIRSGRDPDTFMSQFLIWSGGVVRSGSRAIGWYQNTKGQVKQ